MAIQINYGEHTYGTVKVVHGKEGVVNIGKYCSIAKEVCVFLSYDHDASNISTYPFLHKEIAKLIRNPKLSITRECAVPHKSNITIGNDVWIGYGAIIFKNVTIGDGAVIGAFTKVTKDIPPYSIVVGYSRVVRKRFSDNDIEFLLRLKWWNFTDQEVADLYPILHSPDIGLLRQWATENKN